MIEKKKLKEELVDLRMYLANAENQALKIIGQVSPESDAYGWELINGTYLDIQVADNRLCKLAKSLGLDKLDLVKPRRVN